MNGAAVKQFSLPRNNAASLWRAAARLSLALLASSLLYALVLFAIDVVAAVRFPFELDYGEGIVWQQALMILRGEGYGDITHYPYIVFHYPPVFHLLSSALAATGIDQLAAGRLLSVLATLTIAGVSGALAFRAVRDDVGVWPAAFCALTAGLVMFTYWPVLRWAPLMRVDMLAVALSFLGIYFGTRSLARPAIIHLASLCFILALYTKQTMLAAPAATFAVLLLARPRLALAGMASAIALGLACLAVLSWMTDGGFLRHIFLYNINRFEWSRLWLMLQGVQISLIFLGLAVIIALQAFWRLIRGCWRPSALRQRMTASEQYLILLIVSVYLLLATLMLALVAKSGSNVNYFIEWMCVWSILIGIGLKESVRLAIAGFGPHGPVGVRALMAASIAALLPLALAWQTFQADTLPNFHRIVHAPVRERAALGAQIRTASRPVVSDDMVLLLKNGKEVPWESAIFAELASTGLWDETPFIAMIRQHRFAFFVTVGECGNRLFDSRYTPAVANAVDAAYPRKQYSKGYVIHWPAER